MSNTELINEIIGLLKSTMNSEELHNFEYGCDAFIIYPVIIDWFISRMYNASEDRLELVLFNRCDYSVEKDNNGAFDAIELLVELNRKVQ